MLYTWSRDTIPSDEAMANSPKNPAHQLDVSSHFMSRSLLTFAGNDLVMARFVLTAML